MPLELLAPAKINLTLEVLGRRPDGYHQIASVMQTISLADRVRLTPSDCIDLSVEGDPWHAVPHGTENLAFRAAQALLKEAGSEVLGARIELDKRIPAAMGLGGG